MGKPGVLANKPGVLVKELINFPESDQIEIRLARFDYHERLGNRPIARVIGAVGEKSAARPGGHREHLDQDRWRPLDQGVGQVAGARRA